MAQTKKKLFQKTKHGCSNKCSFFFASAKRHIKRQFADLFPATTGQTVRGRKVAESYGWSLLIYRLAETKLFDVAGSGKDSIQCAEEAELYRAFHFLSSRNALEKLNEIKK